MMILFTFSMMIPISDQISFFVSTLSYFASHFGSSVSNLFTVRWMFGMKNVIIPATKNWSNRLIVKINWNEAKWYDWWNYYRLKLFQSDKKLQHSYFPIKWQQHSIPLSNRFDQTSSIYRVPCLCWLYKYFKFIF